MLYSFSVTTLRAFPDDVSSTAPPQAPTPVGTAY
jgi:hypothetical protein